jgi:hypothetical protein
VFGLDWMTLMASVIDEAVRDHRNLVVVDTLSMYLQLGASEQTNPVQLRGEPEAPVRLRQACRGQRVDAAP